MIIQKRNGQDEEFDASKISQFITKMVHIEPRLHGVHVQKTVKSIQNGLSDTMSSNEMLNYITDHCASLGTHSYDYSLLAGRISMVMMHKNTPSSFTEAMGRVSDLLLPSFLERVRAYDYDQHIVHDNDFTYDVLGVSTLKRSYLLRDKVGVVERPQYMLMRVAVFLSDSPEEAVQTYSIMSKGLYTHASPTLFHAGMKQHQLASCFLMTMKEDSIAGIYDSIKDTALISKSAGGIGISVSNIRAKGSVINGTNGSSNGLVPMLRVLNNTARYCDQGGGKRKGSFAIFIEPWHADIFDVLSLKLNHGLEEERARDLFYSLFISDLFMKRVEADAMWSLFCPTDAPKLQETYGPAFETVYVMYEEMGLARKQVSARELWNKIISTQMETGTPYLVYKDACNSKSNQKHLGVIKSSNLCAEIVEYSSPTETAVCTLASIALPKFVTENGFDYDGLVDIAGTVVKNLNHVIDKTSYPVESARTSNTRHRPMAIGVQGLADVFQALGIPYDSEEAKETNSLIFESIYYGAVKKSIELAKKDGPYMSFKNSPASEGYFNFDMWSHTPSDRYDWSGLRKEMKKFGLRNSLLTGCMPTASSASILGNTESFEPRTSNLYIRRVLSGEFMIMNKYLESACRKRNLWTPTLRDEIIRNRGSVRDTSLPNDLKRVFRTVWEMSQKSLIDLSAGRAPFICQSQSLNLYQAAPTKNSLTSMHFYAWKKGLKTGQYYLRSQPKSNAIAFTAKSTVKVYETKESVDSDNSVYEKPVEEGYTIYTKSQCTTCDAIKKILPDAHYVNCDTYLEDVDEFFTFLESLTDTPPSTFPMVFHNKVYKGGLQEIASSSYGEACVSCSA